MPPFVSPFVGGKRKADEEINSQLSKKLASGVDRGTGFHSEVQYWMVQWRAPQTRKHKTWDGDGVLVVDGKKIELYNMDAESIGSSRLSTEIQGVQGESLRSGGKEIELDHPISRQDYLSGKCFGAHASNPAPVNTQPVAKFKPLVSKVAIKPLIPSSVTKPPLKTRAEPLADVVINLDTEDIDVIDAPLEVARYWTAQWRKPQTRKNKTWDGDAVVSQCGSVVKLFTDAGELLGTTTRIEKLKSGTTLFISGKEIEIDARTRNFGVDNALETEPRVTPYTIPKQPMTAMSNPSRYSATDSERKKPALSIANTNTQVEEPTSSGSATRFWTAQWRKPQTRKNKTWDGDAIVSQCGAIVKLFNEKGGLLGTIKRDEKLYSGATLFISGKEVEIDSPTTGFTEKTTDLESNSRTDSFSTHKESTSAAYKAPKFNPPLVVSKSVKEDVKGKSKEINAEAFYAASIKFQQKHDPNIPNALVLPAPDQAHQDKFNHKKSPVVPVVVDPVIARFLRPHQREGVTFLYKNVMGMQRHGGRGCILADEMGLGKTIQTIALLWTLLKQNPYGGSGVISKALIVCPVTLIKNWKKEIHKWLGKDRIGVFVGDKDKEAIKPFMNSRIHHVLIIGYEKLRTVIDQLAYCSPPIGLIVCDEGHRLKSSDSKTTKMFEALKTPRRIILSGTPVQNNLGEFHAMAHFCNPNLLDTYKVFNQTYEMPILRSRAPDCTAKNYELGNARAEQLTELSRSFVLRRSADILSSYLPPKHEYVVFVTPTPLQLAMFAKILQPERINELGTSMVKSLALISQLGKLCNSPMLLRKKKDDAELSATTRAGIQSALTLLPETASLDDMSLSGKLIALEGILRAIRKDTDEKVVIVSHFTSTLDAIEAFCIRKRYTLFRIDGSTKVENRQTFVDQFNRTDQSARFIFLLSAKAGGTGLNVVGASRLVLVDSDWNPSHDLQAMARIHRDGQKRPVYIYRLLTCGTIDEKIFQRGITKMGLSESLMGQTSDGSKSSKGDSFSQSELRDLFTVHHTACQTHQLLACACASGSSSRQSSPARDSSAELDAVDEDGENKEDEDDDEENFAVGFVRASLYKPPKVNEESKAVVKTALNALDQWTHVNCFNPSARERIRDTILLKVMPVYANADSTGLPRSKTTVSSRPAASLLEATDIDLVGDISQAEGDEEENTRDYDSRLADAPGGTVSFVFEKISEPSMDKDLPT